MTVNMLSVPDDGDMVSWNANTSGLAVGGVSIGVGTWSNWWPQPEYHYHYERPITLSPNAYEAAFKIVAKMLETGVVEEMTLKKFVALVNDVATIVKGS